MSEYAVRPKIEKQTKPQGYICGVCGGQVLHNGLICPDCKPEIFFAVHIKGTK